MAALTSTFWSASGSALDESSVLLSFPTRRSSDLAYERECSVVTLPPIRISRAWPAWPPSSSCRCVSSVGWGRCCRGPVWERAAPAGACNLPLRLPLLRPVDRRARAVVEAGSNGGIDQHVLVGQRQRIERVQRPDLTTCGVHATAALQIRQERRVVAAIVELQSPHRTQVLDRLQMRFIGRFGALLPGPAGRLQLLLRLPLLRPVDPRARAVVEAGSN